MPNETGAQGWEQVKARKRTLLTRVLGNLSEHEQSIFLELLRLEAEQRHLKHKRINIPLRDFVKNQIRRGAAE